MNFTYLFLCILPSQLLWSAATAHPIKPTKKATPKSITMTPEQLSAGTVRLRMPLTYTEPITGKTLEELSQETVERGLPLELGQVLIRSVGNGSTICEIIDVRALIRAYKTWNHNLLNPKIIRIDMNNIKNIVIKTLNSYVEKSVHKKQLGGFSTNIISPSYKSCKLAQWSTSMTVELPDKRRLTFDHVTLSTLALLYEFSKHPYVLKMINLLYEMIARHPETPTKLRFDLEERRRRLHASFATELDLNK